MRFFRALLFPILLSFFVSCFTNFASGQNLIGLFYDRSGGGPGEWIDIRARGIRYHHLIWTTEGAPTGCILILQKSADGITPDSTNIIDPTSCASSSASAITAANTNYVRIFPTSLTGGTSSLRLRVYYRGLLDDPIPGGGSVDSELPAAAALADNMANPTPPAVGAFALIWDGATWDRWTGAVTGTVTANAGTGTFIVGDGAGALNTIIDSGTVTANAGTGTFAVSAASLPLPTGAATETTLAAINTKIPASPAANNTTSTQFNSVRCTDGTAFCLFATEGTAASMLTALNSIDTKVVADIAHDLPDTGNPVKVGCKASASAPANVTEGDRANCSSTLDGTIRVQANAGTNLNTSALALESGGNLANLATYLQPGTMKRYISVGTTEDESEVKATAGVLLAVNAWNVNATNKAMLKCTNLTAVNTTPGTSAVWFSMVIPAATGFVQGMLGPGGVTFTTALTCYIVLGAADAAVDEVVANEVGYNLIYR